MEIYCTSKNTGPLTAGPDPIHMLYLGTSEDDAIAAVGTFVKYEKPESPGFWQTALLASVDGQELAHWYMADGWWYSIVKFELFDALH